MQQLRYVNSAPSRQAPATGLRNRASVQRFVTYSLTVQAKLAHKIRGFAFWSAGFNVLDRSYSDTCFVGPVESEVSFLYPAAGVFCTWDIGPH